MEITLPVVLEWSNEEPSGYFEIRNTLGRVVPNPRELAPDLEGGTLVVNSSGVRVVWHREGGGVIRGAAEVPVAAWAELEAQWWEGRVLVSEAVYADGSRRHRSGSVTLEGEDVRLLTLTLGDAARLMGAASVDKSNLRLAVAVHGSLLEGEDVTRPEQASVGVTGAALRVKVTAPDGVDLVSPEVTLWRLGF